MCGVQDPLAWWRGIFGILVLLEAAQNAEAGIL